MEFFHLEVIPIGRHRLDIYIFHEALKLLFHSLLVVESLQKGHHLDSIEAIELCELATLDQNVYVYRLNRHFGLLNFAVNIPIDK